MSKIKAFIPAAGYGERLRPITSHIPKPLLPILGKPVIEIVLDSTSSLSPHAIGINMHHQWEKIRAWAGASRYAGTVRLFHEDPILGTGGALKNAESLLKDSTFIVHNSDILTDINLADLLKKHIESGSIATLATHDHEKFNNVWTDENGNLKYVGRDAGGESSGLCKVAFMGVAIYSPEFLDFLPQGSSSVVNAWLEAIAKGHIIGTADFTGAAWTDIGTPDAYAAAVFEALKKEGEAVFVHDGVNCSQVNLGGNAVIEREVVVEAQAYISNSILLPGARISHGVIIDHLIAGRGFTIDLDRTMPMDRIFIKPSLLSWFGSSAGSAGSVCIGTGGSDRTYYRISNEDKTAILMKCADADQDYARHIAYTRFFRKYGLPVPEIYMHNEQNKQALFEDLGDLSLYSWLKCRRSPDRIETMYKNIIDNLVALHTAATDNLTECPLLQERLFDYDHLRWETSYFLEHFVMGTKEINVNKGGKLEAEFDNLARKVDAYKKTIVHRDFQSQNIMVTVGDIPRLIDYQGARIGPPAYDIASMLWDPYFRIEDKMRERILEFYILRMKESQNTFDETEFRQSLLPCRLQRHMQALGAYGFLSKVKGKNYFLKHVPQALDYLKEEAGLAKEEYPALNELTPRLS